jgi:hypothetical protein
LVRKDFLDSMIELRNISKREVQEDIKSTKRPKTEFKLRKLYNNNNNNTDNRTDFYKAKLRPCV